MLSIEVDGWIEGLNFGNPTSSGRSLKENRPGLFVSVGGANSAGGAMHPDDVLKLYEYLAPFVERIKQHGHCGFRLRTNPRPTCRNTNS